MSSGRLVPLSNFLSNLVSDALTLLLQATSHTCTLLLFVFFLVGKYRAARSGKKYGHGVFNTPTESTVAPRLHYFRGARVGSSPSFAPRLHCYRGARAESFLLSINVRSFAA